MSGQKPTVEQMLQAVVNTFQEQADQSRENASVLASDPLVGAIARTRSDTYQVAADLVRKRLAELGDLQSTYDAMITAKAQAAHFEGLLIELGKLTYAASKGDELAQRRAADLLMPYVALAMSPGDKSIQ